MADYYTHVSFVIPAVSEAEGKWLTAVFKGLENGTDEEGSELFPGLEISDSLRKNLAVASAHEYWGLGGHLYASLDEGFWVASEDSPNLDALGEVLVEFLSLYRPTDVITFTWAETCSRPRAGAFSGGVCICSAEGSLWRTLGALEEAAKRNWEQHKLLSFDLAEDL